MKKRSFLLMELVISIILLSLLLGVLGSWSYRIFLSQRQDRQAYQSFLEEYRTYQRLRKYFLSATTLQIDEQALCILTFDRGVYSDPDLAGTVLGRLYYDDKRHQLGMSIHSMRNLEKSESLVLLNDVLFAQLIPQEREARLPQGILLTIDRTYAKTVKHLAFQFVIDT